MDALILEDYPYWWQQWSRTPHGSSLTARPELKWKYFKDLHTTKIVFHMWHILSGKDLHGAETTDLGWFMRSTQLLWLNWKLALTFIRKLQRTASEQCTLVMYIKLDPQQLHCSMTQPHSRQSLWASAAHGELQDGVRDTEGGCSPQASSPDLWAPDCTKKQSPRLPRHNAKQQTLHLICLSLQQRRNKRKRPRKSCQKQFNQQGKAAGLQRPIL